jgi:flagellar motor switch protein FliN/FliY
VSEELDDIHEDVAATGARPDPGGDDADAHEFVPLAPAGGAGAVNGLELLYDVEMGVTAELGRARLRVKEILDLAPGSVVALDRPVGTPIDVLVNGTPIARGEVVVLDEEFAVRIVEVLGYGGDRRGLAP